MEPSDRGSKQAQSFFIIKMWQEKNKQKGQTERIESWNSNERRFHCLINTYNSQNTKQFDMAQKYNYEFCIVTQYDREKIQIKKFWNLLRSMATSRNSFGYQKWTS